MNKVDETELTRLSQIFKTTIEKVNSAIGPRAFRIIRALNAAAFDAIMVGLAKRLELSPEPADDDVLSAHNRLVNNNDFKQLCERATADESNVRNRLALATSTFADI